jgi:hypothetical protein
MRNLLRKAVVQKGSVLPMIMIMMMMMMMSVMGLKYSSNEKKSLFLGNLLESGSLGGK